MSRPKPNILLDKIEKSESRNGNVKYINFEVLESDGVYAVFYKNSPINLRSVSAYTTDLNPKYKKSAFGNKGHAINLAGKLNEFYNTVDFTVVKLTIGETLN